jgi:hypothetical protein
MRHAWNKHSETASSIRVTAYLARASYGFALAHRDSDGSTNGGSGSSSPFLGFIAQVSFPLSRTTRPSALESYTLADRSTAATCIAPLGRTVVLTNNDA